MTTNKVIDGLYFTIGMILFNPMTGESKTSDELNQDDRTTYDACMGAIELLKAQQKELEELKLCRHKCKIDCLLKCYNELDEKYKALLNEHEKKPRRRRKNESYDDWSGAQGNDGERIREQAKRSEWGIYG